MRKTLGWLKKRGNIFFACWRHKGKVHVKTTGQTVRRRAEEELARIVAPYRLVNEAETVRALAARADVLDAAAAEATPALTLAEGWSAYLGAGNRPDTGAATLEQYEVQYDRFRRWIAKAHPEITHMREVTVDHAREFRASIEADRRSPRTCNAYLNLLALVWRVLAETARTTVNPWTPDHVARKKQENGTGRQELPVDVLRVVVERAEGEMRTLFAVGLYCGLRLGDACRLSWEEVDFDRGAIVTTPHKTAGSSGAMVAIPIAPPLRRVLQEIRPARPRGPIMPELAALYARRPRGVVQKVQDHFAACGIETVARLANRERQRVLVGFHSLRHSFISHAAMAGWPEALVRAIVGHTSSQVTKRYIHLQTLAAKSLPALPDVLAAECPTALPAPASLDWRAEVSRIVDRLNANTWEAAREALARLATAPR